MRNLRKTEIICPECRKVVVKKREDQRFCGAACRKNFFQRFKRKAKKVEKTLQDNEYLFKKDDGSIIVKQKIPILPKTMCRSCDKDFIPMFPNEWYCSHICRHVQKRLVYSR